KRSGATTWKWWKTWAKLIKAVIGCASECQKQRDSQGGTNFPLKGGVAGGVKNARFSGKTRFKVVKPGQFRAHFGRNRASSGAFEFILIESVFESGPKRPHPHPGPAKAKAPERVRGLEARCRHDGFTRSPR